jgi:hypothetical protein
MLGHGLIFYSCLTTMKMGAKIFCFKTAYLIHVMYSVTDLWNWKVSNIHQG